MRISDWSSDVCSSDLGLHEKAAPGGAVARQGDTAQAQDAEQQQPGNQGAAGDQGDRRDGGYAELDEGVGGTPQGRQRQQQGELDGGGGRLGGLVGHGVRVGLL